MTQPRMLARGGWPFDPRRPREDHGLFGPKSPTWKVWTSPTALIAFQRAVVVETFDPFLTAAVADAQGVYSDARGRLDSTLTYFTIVAVGDSRAAIESSELLKKVHARATGTEPISGRRYSANDPDSQLWIHVTGWHSVLKCYEVYGPGPLSADEEARFWADCVTAAELQTCDPRKVPSSRAEVHAYFEQQRPRLCMSERARKLSHHLLFPEAQRGSRAFAPSAHLLARASIATIPSWMRVLAGFDQSPAVDAAIKPLARAMVRSATPLPNRLALVDLFAPSIRPIWESALAGPPPIRDETLSPSVAKSRHGQHRARSPQSTVST